jgi:hypothetical protein
VVIRPDRWEHGSEFHWLRWEPPAEPVRHPWDAQPLFFGSGRDAFGALLNYGQTKMGWRRLWVPSYFCQEVVEAFVATGIGLAMYCDSPREETLVERRIDIRSGDVALRVDYFGLRKQMVTFGVKRSKIAVIDDYSHSPWSPAAWRSDADWCVASLRKTLPIPDGGVLWSPKGISLPQSCVVTEERRSASLQKLAGMTLKKMYLEGQSSEKELYRNLVSAGERQIAVGTHSGMTPWSLNLLSTCPTAEWQAQRTRNHRAISEALHDLVWLEVLQPEDRAGGQPFSAVLVFDCAERREFVRTNLIASRVYPAVIWPLQKTCISDLSEDDVDLSARMLSIHCDMRYGDKDMRQVALLVRQFGNSFEHAK